MDSNAPPTPVPAPDPVALSVNFSSQIGVGSPYVFGETGSPQNYAVAPSVMKQGFVWERLDAKLNQIVPASTIADYRNNVNNIQDPSKWNYGSLQKLAYYGNGYGGRTLRFMVIIGYVPTWLSYDNTTTGVPADFDVFTDIVTKLMAYLTSKKCVRYVEVWNEPTGQFLTVAGSPYATNIAAYQDIYLHAVKAIRAVDQTVLIGGPAAGAPGYAWSWADTLLGNPAISSDIQFLSFHHYNKDSDTDASDIAAWKAVAAKHGRPQLPVFMSEWNYAWDMGNIAINNGSSDAISFVGRRLSAFLLAGLTGASIFKIGMNADNSFQPKTQVFRLMSVIMGLGAGPSQLVSTVPDASSNVNANLTCVTVALAALNSAGIPVACLTNNTSVAGTTDVSVAGLANNRTYNVSVWVASASDGTTAPAQSYSVLTDTSGSAALPTIAVPPKSVVGVTFAYSQGH